MPKFIPKLCNVGSIDLLMARVMYCLSSFEYS